MLNVNYLILNDSLVVNFNGETHNVIKGDGRYSDIVEAIKNGELDKIPSLISVVDKFSNVPGLVIKNNNVYLDGIILEGVIAERILQFSEAQLPYEPLILFARKLRMNPSFNSRQMLYKFLEHNGHPITPAGNFIAYRGVTEDFKDKHTKTFDNSIGAVCSMPRDSVDDNPNNTCSNGLHVACYDYAKGFAPVLVEVEVNPIDVVAVPTDYNGTKMRVCKFKVVNLCKSVRNEPLYTDSEHTETVIDSEETDDSEWVELNLVSSSVVNKAIYNPTTMELQVNLNNGNYRYFDVEQSVIDDWENASSAGGYYANHIVHQYSYEAI